MSQSDQAAALVVHQHYAMGAAPYSLNAIWSMPGKGLLEANPAAYNNAMKSRPSCCRGRCDHCGTGITHHFIIQDAAGARFCVGSSCIDKLGDTTLTTAALHARNKQAQTFRAAKRLAEQHRKQAACEAELEAQRIQNGGCTDDEIQQQKDLAAKRMLQDQRAAAASEVIMGLSQAGGDFVQSIVRQLKTGQLPTGGARIICMEIMAKQAGRKNSARYKAAYPLCGAAYLAMEARFQKLV